MNWGWLAELRNVSKETWIALSFVPIAAAFFLALWRADRGDTSTFKLIHFVTTDTGRGSNKELGYTMLVVVCAWGTWALILLDKLTEWYIYGELGAFVIGSLGARWTQAKARIEGAPEPEANAGDATAPKLSATGNGGIRNPLEREEPLPPITR